MCRTSIPKRAGIDNWKVVFELIQGWKKGCSDGKIELRKRKAEFEMLKILA